VDILNISCDNSFNTIITLNVQNVHRWLTHMPAVTCSGFSQRCEWLSLVRQTNLIEVHYLNSGTIFGWFCSL